MEKQYKKVRGQQFFFVSTLMLFYCYIIVLVVLLLTAGSNKIQEALRAIGIVTLFVIPILAVIALILFAISRIWVKPYATMAEDHIILEGEKIFYHDIEQIVLVPGTWTTGYKAYPYGPAEVYVYHKGQDYTLADGISYHFCLQLKKRCPHATFRCKYLLHIFLLAPLGCALVAIILGILFRFFPEE